MKKKKKKKKKSEKQTVCQERGQACLHGKRVRTLSSVVIVLNNSLAQTIA